MPTTTSALMGAFLRHGIDVCSTAMTPWVWPAMTLNPPSWIDPITEACQEGGASCFTTGIDPGFANDLFPMTLMGLCAEVRSVKALEILDYINYTGDYEEEMGIGRSPDFTPLLEHSDILVMSWGATVPMMAHAVGIELDRITTTWDKWVTPAPIRLRRASSIPARSPPSTSPSTGFSTGRPASRSSTSTGWAPTPPPTGPAAPRTTSTGWRSRGRRRSSRRRPSASPTAADVMPPPLAAWPRVCARLNAVPAVNDLDPGWVTALDLPAHRRRRHHPLTGETMDPTAVLALCHEHAAAEAAFDVDRILRTLVPAARLRVLSGQPFAHGLGHVSRPSTASSTHASRPR